MKIEAWLYWLEGLLVMVAVMFLMPMDDDWFFLRYFDNHLSWDEAGYLWLKDNHFLIRDYWRPIEDVILGAEARYAPWLFPWLQHFMIVALAFGSGWSARCLGIRAGASPRVMTIIMGVGMLVATNLGALTSIDSFTQVSAAFWGLLSVRIFCSKLTLRWLWWIVAMILACMSKESGFIFAIIGPAYKWFVSDNQIFTRKAVKQVMPGACVAVAVMGLYLGFYFGMKQEYQSYKEQHCAVAVENTLPEPEQDKVQHWDESSRSHELTPITLVKNIAILYGLGLYPVAVSGFYYDNYAIVAITLLLGWGGCVMMWRIWRRATRRRRVMFLRLVLLGLCVSLPAMITRAGEISSFNSNMLFTAAVGVLATGYRPGRTDQLLAISFVFVTLLTDSYKYSLAYRGGAVGAKMGNEAARFTPAGAKRILWVGVDESGRDKAGAAFNKSPYRAFGQGNAAIRALGYPQELILTRIKVADKPGAELTVDSIANANAGCYDCIWISSEDNVEVIKR